MDTTAAFKNTKIADNDTADNSPTTSVNLTAVYGEILRRLPGGRVYTNESQSIVRATAALIDEFETVRSFAASVGITASYVTAQTGRGSKREDNELKTEAGETSDSDTDFLDAHNRSGQYTCPL